MRFAGMNETTPADPVREVGLSDPSEEVLGDGEGEEGGTELDELRKEIESLKDRHLRLAAEFDNYRKRSSAQLNETATRAQAHLVGRIIEVIDDFQRIASLSPSGTPVESVLEGVGLVERKLARLLQEAGLEEMDPVGEHFDPNMMEAMVRVPTDDPAQDDTVDQVFQRGFRFGGHLVRPARVSVRKHE
jgi:molecular chaperone GrpE